MRRRLPLRSRGLTAPPPGLRPSGLRNLTTWAVHITQHNPRGPRSLSQLSSMSSASLFGVPRNPTTPRRALTHARPPANAKRRTAPKRAPPRSSFFSYLSFLSHPHHHPLSLHHAHISPLAPALSSTSPHQHKITINANLHSHHTNIITRYLLINITSSIPLPRSYAKIPNTFKIQAR